MVANLLLAHEGVQRTTEIMNLINSFLVAIALIVLILFLIGRKL